jgi:TolB-like protein/Flp pilus assembly protein TadD
LLRRIYRKWKEALPDLEHAPLFTIPGRRKEYGGPTGKTYSFTDEEKDAWANLFEYKGSHENVRLHFSIDRIGATLDQVIVTYGEEPYITNEYPWDRFIESLKRELSDPDSKDKGHVAPTPRKRSWWSPWPWRSLGGVVGLLLMGVIVAIWYFSFHKPKSASDGFLFIESPLPLPDKPSVAVLPFTNMSGDPEQEYFSDGITEEILTALSKIGNMFVIARTSSFKYKGNDVDVRKVGRELGVRYVLEGSVRRSEDQLRITAQLVDAKTGNHVWAERYERRLKDIFALQDEITKKIITELQVQLTDGEQMRLLAKGTENIQAYLKFLQARQHILPQTKEGIALARSLSEEAIALDPNSAPAYNILGMTYWMSVLLGTSRSPKQSLTKARDLAQKAIALDESYAPAHSLLGLLYIMQARMYEKAIAECERAVALDPNNSFAHFYLSLVLRYAGRHEKALQEAEYALRLDPIPHGGLIRNLGLTYFYNGRYDDAIATLEKALIRMPENFKLQVMLTSAYSQAGRKDEAGTKAAKVLRLRPKYCIPSWHPYKNPADAELYRNGLRKAGLRDCPTP